MKKGQSHPASALSQKLLADGLLSLLEQKPFREITIKELCAHSDIARRTFYRHFSSVEDVMAYVVSHIIENFKKHMLQVAERGVSRYSRFLLRFLQGLRLSAGASEQK